MSSSHGNDRIAVSAKKGEETRKKAGLERIESATPINVPAIEYRLPGAERQEVQERQSPEHSDRLARLYLWAAIVLPVSALFLATFVIGTHGLLVGEPGNPLRPIALSALVPVALFLLIYWRSPTLRAFLSRQSPVFVTALQSWRVVGFAFLPIYAFGYLPALFAWPAGIGDLLVGLAAPFVAWRLLKDPGFLKTRRFLAFHLLGLFDFALAITTAALTSGVAPRLIPGGISSAAMEIWPMNIFPGFFVPLFIVLHLAVLLPLMATRKARTLHHAGSLVRGAT
jgi:hypothetical protein